MILKVKMLTTTDNKVKRIKVLVLEINTTFILYMMKLLYTCTSELFILHKLILALFTVYFNYIYQYTKINSDNRTE